MVAVTPDGVFGKNWNFALKDVIDGLSNTIFVGEIFPVHRRARGGGTTPNYVPFYPGGHRLQTGFQNDTRPVGWATEAAGINGKAQSFPLLNSSFYTPQTSTDLMNWWQIPAVQTYGQLGFHSQHPGGANILFGDGSVRFLKTSTNLATLRSLGTRANGEVVSSDSY